MKTENIYFLYDKKFNLRNINKIKKNCIYFLPK